MYLKRPLWAFKKQRTNSINNNTSAIFSRTRGSIQLYVCLVISGFHRPLPCSKNPYFQIEARCTTFLVKMSFICMRMKNDFHIKGWAPTVVLKHRPGGTRKRPIERGWNKMCAFFSTSEKCIQHWNLLKFFKSLTQWAAPLRTFGQILRQRDTSAE